MDQILNECKNCGNHYVGNYCNKCGQKATVKRFSITMLFSEFIHGFYHIHGGFFYTLKELTVRPGVTLRNYLAGKRIHHFNPFTYLLLIGVAGGFIFSHIDVVSHLAKNVLSFPEAMIFSGKNYGIRLLLSIPIYALITMSLFRSFRYNYAEHLILMSYMITHSALVIILWYLPLTFATFNDIGYTIIFNSATLMSIIYQCIMIISIFNKGNKLLRGFKALALIVLGYSLSLTFIYLILKLKLLYR